MSYMVINHMQPTQNIKIIRQFEELSANAWAAPFTTLYDGWVIRYARGYTRRANSVMPLYPGALPLDDKLSYCEQFFEDRSLSTIFKMTTAALPTNLDDALAQLGYTYGAATSVQTLDLNRLTVAMNTGMAQLDIRSYPSKVWIGAFQKMNDVAAIHHEVSRQMLAEHLLQPTHFVLLWDGSDPVAVAMLVIERGYAGIFDVVVNPQHRGNGYGRQMMLYLLALAQQNGAHTAYLQVMQENERAQRLYESLGFREVYSYWYRRKALST